MPGAAGTGAGAPRERPAFRRRVELDTVRAWLGHASLDTTNIYAEIDFEGKAKALAKCDITNEVGPTKRWLKTPDLMQFLRSL